MAKTVSDLNSQIVTVDTTLDNVIIKKNRDSFSQTLSTVGITDQTISAGRVIIVTSGGIYKPQTITGNAYIAPAEGETYAGILVGSILTSKPFAAITINGTVNTASMAVKPTAAAITALSHIVFTSDK